MLKVKKLCSEAKLPTVANPGEDLGYDLYAKNDVTVPRGGHALIRTGIAAFQEGHGLLIRDRSSMAKVGVMVTGGVVDAGYRGEIMVLLSYNGAMDEFKVRQGDKIAQMIPLPVLTGEVVEIEELPASTRGEKGFGSSGR